MAYRGLTAIGANYLATRLAQELPVEFTKVQIGAGTPVGNPSDVTNLKNYKLDAKILKKSQENNTVEITIQVVNDNIDQGFYLKEIGVFVNDDTEKLYWYCNEDNAQYIPAKTDSAIAFEIDIKMEVTNVESPILNWSGQGTWIDKKYLESELIKKIDKGGYSGNAKNLDDDIKKRLIQGTIPNSLNSAEKIVAALQGNGGLRFDENLLYLNDSGTKKKGFYYLDKLKNGIFECLEQTTVTVNDSSKFKDISNKSNSDRLDNLSKNYGEVQKKVSKTGDTMTGNLVISKGGDTRVTFRDASTKTAKLELVRTADDDIYLENYTTKKYLKLKADGSTELMADNLETESKEVIGAINELNSNKIAKTKRITVTDFNLLIDEGNFTARITPEVLNGPIVLEPGDGYNCRIEILLSHYNIVFQRVILTPEISYIRQIIKTNTAATYVWTKELSTLITKEFLGQMGVSGIQYIQDSGQKIKNNGYIDKNTGKLYIAKESNSDTTVTNKFRLATNIDNAKEPKTVELFTKKSITQNTQITLIAENEIQSYSEFDEIEFIADYDGNGECSAHRVTIGAILRAYDTYEEGIEENRGRVVFWISDTANRIEIKRQQNIGIIIRNKYSDWYLANCRIIRRYS